MLLRAHAEMHLKLRQGRKDQRTLLFGEPRMRQGELHTRLMRKLLQTVGAKFSGKLPQRLTDKN